MNRTQPIPGRPWVRRLTACLLVLGGVGVWISCAVTEAEALQLNAHGVRTTATVDQVDVLKNSDSCWVTFIALSGVQLTEWVEGVPHGVTPGSQFTVVYDPNDPSTIQDLRVMESTRWSAPEWQVPFGLAFAGFGWLILRRGVPVGLGGSVQFWELFTRRREPRATLLPVPDSTLR